MNRRADRIKALFAGVKQSAQKGKGNLSSWSSISAEARGGPQIHRKITLIRNAAGDIVDGFLFASTQGRFRG
jgi:hypothetical protein